MIFLLKAGRIYGPWVGRHKSVGGSSQVKIVTTSSQVGSNSGT
jgi:hypothetical protein